MKIWLFVLLNLFAQSAFAWSDSEKREVLKPLGSLALSFMCQKIPFSDGQVAHIKYTPNSNRHERLDRLIDTHHGKGVFEKISAATNEQNIYLVDNKQVSIERYKSTSGSSSIIKFNSIGKSMITKDCEGIRFGYGQVTRLSLTDPVTHGGQRKTFGKLTVELTPTNSEIGDIYIRFRTPPSMTRDYVVSLNEVSTGVWSIEDFKAIPRID